MAFQRFGSYEILGRIGRGGMATVSLARADASLRLPPIVCLKTLRYTTEFFAPLFKPKRVNKFVDKLSDLQDAFGEYRRPKPMT